MGMQDTTRLLQGMGRTYPDGVRADEISRHIGIDGLRAVRAVRGLFEGGLITAHGTPCVEGMLESEFMLTEPGMVVAFGLVSIEGDPRGAIAALEAHTLRQLHRSRERSMSGKQGLPADAGAAIRPSPDRRAPR